METIEAAWTAHRRRVFDVAYRMLGSVSDADDIVQEAYLRLTRVGLPSIDDVEAWLVTVTGRLCLDRLRSASVTRAAYVGPWLPEPLVEPVAEDRVTLDESVRMALLVVLDQLSPAERTSFLLHDVFGLPFDEVADVVGRTPAACRQLASRARRRVEADAAKPRSATSPTRAQLEQVAHRFAAACRTGRFEDLVDVLDPAAISEFDSGGAIPGASLRRVEGGDRIARSLSRLFTRADMEVSVTEVNGEPGIVLTRDEQVGAVMALTSDGERVLAIHSIGNPAKLAHLDPRS